MDPIKNVFRNINNPGSQRELDPSHILRFYYGITDNGKKEFMLVSPGKPPTCTSTGSINVESTIRPDGLYVLNFRLEDDSYAEMFYSFCEDIVEFTRTIKNIKDGSRLVVKRYKDWQKMLRANAHGPLSDLEIKGLAGELYFLKNILAAEIGLSNAVKAWVGPEGADQDFRINDTWYEVKTTSPGNDLINISSVEQLDVKDNGELIILFADITSDADSEGESLYTLFQAIDSEIRRTCNTDIEDRFWNLLNYKNFTLSDIYKHPRFRFRDVWKYKVDQNFPCIRSSTLPDSVTKLTYKLILSTLDSFAIK